MQPVIDFGDLLSGLQQLPEREKIILPALINAVRIAQNGEVAKIERFVGQTIIAAAQATGATRSRELRLQRDRTTGRSSSYPHCECRPLSTAPTPLNACGNLAASLKASRGDPILGEEAPRNPQDGESNAAEDVPGADLAASALESTLGATQRHF